METDSFNLYSRPHHVVNQKRPRSPDTLPLGRTPKRQVLYTHDILPGPHASGRHSTPEDWVQQTRGLSIASPIFPNVGPGPAPEMPLCDIMVGDEDMNVDIDPEPRTRPSSHHVYGAGMTPGLEDMAVSTELPTAHAMAAVGVAEPHHHPHPMGTPAMGFAQEAIAPASTQPPLNPRKLPRIAMGPRSGCKLCEDRVEGHFMHLM
ncbi:hypothetical protein BD779DRAFT_1502403 [Infundibulicybe gibba]|nr:hypothetical protein BD779DRAFT_1502403 [Infundibulicybe gibba]